MARAALGLLVASLAAVAAAFAAMLAVAAAGLHLAGLGGTLRPAAAVVALAVGGSVRLSTAGGGIVGVRGLVEGVPLGVTLAGALAMAAVRRFSGAGRAPAGRVAVGRVAVGRVAVGRVAVGRVALPALAGPALTVAVFLPVLAGVAVAGRGTVTLGAPGATLAYRPDLGRTLAGGLVWVVVVLAATSGALWRGGPAVVRAGILVLSGTGLVSMLAGPALAPFVHDGQRLAGLGLLAGPNVAGAFLTLGLHVPWSAGVTGLPAGPGPAGARPPIPGLPAGRLPPGLGSRLGSGLGSHLAPGLKSGLTWHHLSGHRWIATLLVGLLLILVAVLALRWRAAGRPDRAGGTGPRRALPDALWFGGCLAVVLAVAVPVLARLAGGSVDLDVSLFGFALAEPRVSLVARWWVAVPAGAVAGALVGTVAGLARARILEGVPARRSG